MSKPTDLTRDDIVQAVCRECKSYRDILVGWIHNLATPTQLPVSVQQDMKDRYGFSGFYVSEIPKLNTFFSAEPTQASVPHFSRLIPNAEEFRFMDGDMWNDEEVTSEMMAYYSSDYNVVCPSDPFWQPAHKKKEEADVNFVRDLTFFTKYSEEGMVPVAPEPAMEDAAMKISHSGLAQFCSNFGSRFVAPGKKGVSTPMYANMLTQSFGSFPQQEQASLKSLFYSLVFGVKAEEGQLLLNSRTGLSLQAADGAALRRDPWKAGLIHRTDPIVENIKRIPSLVDYLRILAAERAIRGEDSQKSSFYSSSTGRGGYVVKSRRQICDILSIYLPLQLDRRGAKGVFSPQTDKRTKTENVSVDVAQDVPKIVIIPHVPSLIPNLVNALTTYHATVSDVGIYCPTKYEEYASTFPYWVQRTLKRNSFVLDFEGSSIPTVRKGVDLVEKWGSQTQSAIESYGGFRGWIAWRKIPPSLASSYNVFFFHSAHSFDVLVSSCPDVRRAVGRVTKKKEQQPVVKVEYLKLPKVPSAQALQAAALQDSRIRTWALVNGTGYVNDCALNLWGRQTMTVTKKDVSRMAIQFLDNDGEDIRVDIAQVDVLLPELSEYRIRRLPTAEASPDKSPPSQEKQERATANSEGDEESENVDDSGARRFNFTE